MLKPKILTDTPSAQVASLWPEAMAGRSYPWSDISDSESVESSSILPKYELARMAGAWKFEWVVVAEGHRREEEFMNIHYEKFGTIDGKTLKLACESPELFKKHPLSLCFQGMTAYQCIRLSHAIHAKKNGELEPGNAADDYFIVTDRGGFGGPCTKFVFQQSGPVGTVGYFRAVNRNAFGGTKQNKRYTTHVKVHRPSMNPSIHPSIHYPSIHPS